MFGIIQRYVLGSLLSSFAMAIVALTTIFVLFIVMAEATRQGLAPQEVLMLVPYLIPGSLPYTLPVAVLFAVTIVYGRLAGDNEVMALKAAGVNPFAILWPALALGLALGVALLQVSQELIPRMNNQAKLVLFKSLEDMFYKALRRDHEFNNDRWPFLITVKDLEEKTLIGAIFKHRTADPNSFDLQVTARRATIRFDLEKRLARVFMEGAEVQRSGGSPDVVLINGRELELPVPAEAASLNPPKKIQEMTQGELVAAQIELRDKMRNERARQAVASGMWIASGQIRNVPWQGLQSAYVEYPTWFKRHALYETEKHLRISLCSGVFFFVLLGAPVGIMFARRDYLSAFISCFLPIIIIYYPLTLAGVNLGKEGLLDPMIGLWMGNCVLGVLAALVLPPVIRH